MKKMKRNTHIKKLSDIIHLGLGSFLVVGLSGCSVDKNCNDDNLKHLSQRDQLECKNKKVYNSSVVAIGSSSSNTRSGFFTSTSSLSSNNSSSGG